MTEYIFPFVNNGGIELLEKFLSKIDNYSIMQIIQRLMLPHIPFLMSCETDDENLLEGKESTSYQCNWSTIPEACDLLCNCMLSAKNGDVASHVSDLLITVLQLSPPDASILYHLCSGECLNSLLSAVFTIDCDHMSLDESMSTNASVSLAALAVLESLISRICEGTTSDLAEKESFSGDVENIHKVNESIVNVVSAVIPYLTVMSSQLKLYKSNSECGNIAIQTKNTIPRLGHRCLLIVKLVESLIRLGNGDIDMALLEADIVSCCIGLIFVYRLNSLLHLSVQRTLTMILENSDGRK